MKKHYHVLHLNKMNIFTYNNTINVKANTIRDLKTILNSSGYDTASAKLILSDGRLVAPEVFQTTTYDNIIITTMLEGSSLVIYPKGKEPKINTVPNILPTIHTKPLEPLTNTTTYYVVVDTGYEGHEEINIPGQPAQQEPFKLIALNHQPTSPSYDATVRFLNETIPQNMTMKYQRQFTNNTIFETNDINSVTINSIINATRSMEYCEIWGTGHDIVQYPITQDITLVHLKLNDVETG